MSVATYLLFYYSRVCESPSFERADRTKICPASAKEVSGDRASLRWEPEETRTR